MQRKGAAVELVCEVCGQPFEAKSPRAKVCGSTCRSRKRRSGRAAEPVATVRPVEPVEDHGVPSSLVAAVTEELERAGVLHTVDGQLALQLATQMSAAGATGISGLSKEFRTVRAQALEGVKPPAPSGPVEPPSIVDRVKEQRDRKAREAASSA